MVLLSNPERSLILAYSESSLSLASSEGALATFNEVPCPTGGFVLVGTSVDGEVFALHAGDVTTSETDPGEKTCFKKEPAVPSGSRYLLVADESQGLHRVGEGVVIGPLETVPAEDQVWIEIPEEEVVGMSEGAGGAVDNEGSNTSVGSEEPLNPDDFPNVDGNANKKLISFTLSEGQGAAINTCSLLGGTLNVAESSARTGAIVCDLVKEEEKEDAKKDEDEEEDEEEKKVIVQKKEKKEGVDSGVVVVIVILAIVLVLAIIAITSVVK